MKLQLLLCVLVGCALAADDIETALSKKPHYSMALDLLRKSGILDQLKQAPQVTLFVPTNQALSDIDRDDYNDLTQDTNTLKMWMQYHASTDMAYHQVNRTTNDLELKSLNTGLPIRINVYWQMHTVTAEGVNITERNMPVANGYMHGIDGYLEAPAGDVVDIINAIDECTTLSKLIAQAGLESTLRGDHNITVFAPEDWAFEDLDDQVMSFLQADTNTLKEVLLYHVVQKTTLYSIGMRHQMTFPTSDSRHDSLMLLEGEDDDEIFLNHALVDERDISATNGVVHTIEALLIPPNVLIKLEDQGLGHLIG